MRVGFTSITRETRCSLCQTIGRLVLLGTDASRLSPRLVQLCAEKGGVCRSSDQSLLANCGNRLYSSIQNSRSDSNPGTTNSTHHSFSWIVVSQKFHQTLSYGSSFSLQISVVAMERNITNIIRRKVGTTRSKFHCTKFT